MALTTRFTSRPTLGAVRARQGRLGRGILWVLLVGMLLVVLGFLATWAFKSPDLTRVENNATAPATAAQSFSAPPPSAAARQNYEAGGPLAPQNHANPGQPGPPTTTQR